MTPDRWQKIEALFNAALERAEPERAAFLDAECGADSGMRAQVERLLRADEMAGSFIEAGAPVPWETQPMPDDQAQRAAGDSMIGHDIGPWRIEREIGRGGMGAVYLAHRADKVFERRVAIKLIKRGMDTDYIVRRFRRERQILASFDHPHIARLLDGGSTADGRPYFVMEYIEGLPVTRWCDERRQPLPERLRLFLQICAAVQYAHRQQVIHRDLKPGNILVTPDGAARLLDFGIARILNPDLAEDTLDPTLTAMRLMTPEYASPEQARGDQVTPASDIYSLGVILYELLAGQRPHRLHNRAPWEIARIINEQNPETPVKALLRLQQASEAVVSGQASPRQISENRGVTTEQLRAQLAGPLENIVMHALGRTPETRYATADALATDITRYLDGAPVSAPVYTPGESLTMVETAPARPETNSIAILPLRMVHLPGAGDSGDFLGVGLADALITRLSNIRTLTVRPTSSVLKYASGDVDAQQAGRELGVTHVLEGRILGFGERIRVTAQLINVRDGASQWAAQFDERGADLLELQDAIAGQLTREIARNLSGEEQAKLAWRGTHDPRAYEACLRGRYHWHTYTEEGMARAITCFYEAIAIDPQYAAAYTGVADYFNWLGLTAVLPPGECFLAAKEAAAQAVRLDDQLPEAYVSLAIATRAHDWDFNASDQLIRRALELNPNHAPAHEWRAHFLSARGQHAEAIAAMKRALELDPLSPALHAMMAFMFHNARRPTEAMSCCRRSLEIEPQYFLALQSRAWLLPFAGAAPEAIQDARRAVDITARAPLSLWVLAHTLAIAGQHAEARQILAEMRALAEKRFIPHYYFSRIYTALGEYDKALDSLARSLDGYESWALEMPVDPHLEPLRANPRFTALLTRLRPRHKTIAAPSYETRPMSAPAPAETAPPPATPDITTPPPPATPRLVTARRIGLALSLLVIGGLGWMAYKQFMATRIVVTRMERPAAGPSTADTAAPRVARSIAVTPFRTASTSEEDRTLSAGIADTLAASLGRLRQLSVRPMSAVRRYLDNDMPLAAIAREQDVDYVIGGTLRRQDKEILLDVRMYGVRENRVLIQAEMSGKQESLARLQSSLAEHVLRVLKFEVTGDELLRLTRRDTGNNAAWQLYLTGRYHFGKRTVAGLREAIGQFQRAVQLDHQFALAYAGLADCYSLLDLYAPQPPRDAIARARENAMRAMELDERLAEPHVSMAYVLFWHDRDHAAAEHAMRRAIELNPSYPTAHHWFALMLTAMGRFPEAEQEIETARRLNPRSPIIRSATAMVAFYARHYDEALTRAGQALELDPGLVAAHKIRRWVHQINGRYEDALAAYAQEKSHSGDGAVEWPAIRAQIEAAAGKTAMAREDLRRALSSAAFKNNPDFLVYELAVAYALLGDRDQAFAWLARADASHRQGFNYLLVDPHLDKIRDDPRYAEMTRKAGFTR
ncbi:MAG: protein kinase domain-containing protein [Blastocatellia bacterium]